MRFYLGLMIVELPAHEDLVCTSILLGVFHTHYKFNNIFVLYQARKLPGDYWY